MACTEHSGFKPCHLPKQAWITVILRIEVWSSSGVNDANSKST